MDEDEFRDALRTVMTKNQEPPPMESAAALAAGRRASRRRTALTCTGVVVALAAVTILPARYLSGGAGAAGGIAPATDPSTPPLMPSPGLPLSGGPNAPDPTDTKPSWPAEASGDATADSGPHYQQGKKLLDELLKVVPGGYQTPQGTSSSGVEYQSHQAQVADPGWDYLASAVIAKDGRAGQFQVEVYTEGVPGAGGRRLTEPCALARAYWGMGGSCQVKRIGSAQVGVAVPGPNDQRIDQWAAYRWADGVVVYMAQTRNATFDPGSSAPPRLLDLPFDANGLAKLATDARFHLHG